MPARREPGGVAGTFRDPEIGEVDAIGSAGLGRGAEQDVGRLHVAVQQTVAMRVVQRGGDPGDRVQRALRRERATAAQGGGRVLTCHVLHVDPELAAGLAAVVDRHHVVVVEACGEVGLALETLPVAGIRRGGYREQLERVQPGQPGVVDEVDLAHPTAADQPLDAKASDELTGLVHRHRPRASACLPLQGKSPLIFAVPEALA